MLKKNSYPDWVTHHCFAASNFPLNLFMVTELYCFAPRHLNDVSLVLICVSLLVP